jgi:methylmalonyl-CoA/ethylmalonyl-CoA epimerase
MADGGSDRARGLDHIGIAVRSLDVTAPLLERVLGIAPRAIESLPEHGVRVAVFVVGESRIELLEPLGDASPIAKFLATRGEGLHHISLGVGDIDGALARLDALGVPLIDRAARAGAEGKRVAFVHPKGAGGILIELSQDPPPAPDRPPASPR